MGIPTVREIAKRMDPVRPPRSVRRLAQLHRWTENRPPRSLAVRQLVERHIDPQRRLRFLGYNTYLMDETIIPIGTLIGVFGGVPGVIAGLIGDLTETTVVRIPAKPALIPRAREIGAALAGNYDLMAVCEVFDADERARLLQAWRGHSAPEFRSGPSDTASNVDLVKQSSGLLTISDGRAITRTRRHVFGNRGSRWLDADAWADKGILMTEIDLGLPQGRLELYNTHLIFGDDLLTPLDPHVAARTRLQQVDELAAFIRATHRPENVVVVAGDFNIKEKDPDLNDPDEAYRRLRLRMERLGLEDIWAERNGTAGYTSDLKAQGTHICWLGDGQVYCDDGIAPEGTGARIDYIFVQRPQAEHGFLLDATRPRRRPFPRPGNAPDLDEIGYMSDHIGLDITFIVTPR